ncbi:MAG: alpha/beta hydrolase family protein [Actinomycetota bacterium]|nr:alpha/beta hydrolase family protein [Actinomycetota bacterium]
MALLRVDFFSDVLGLSTSMTVILPQRTSRQIGLTGQSSGAAPPVLYLLHGLSDDDTIWTRRTSIERYAAAYGLAVVMPQVHTSFYSDEVSGLPFWTFMTEELPVLVQSLFRVSADQADTFVAGLSMGGYGAMKWALRHPDRFAAAASLSGALGLTGAPDGLDPAFDRLMTTVFGGPITGTDDDVLHLASTTEPGSCPGLYVACGTDDFLLSASKHFIDIAERRGLPITARIASGDHDWEYWDAQIQDVLAWLPLR